ncbi:MAG: hypothetical protein AAFV29_22775, partial [Myxococcota bacterium]
PREVGVSNLLLTVTDSEGRSARRAFALEVLADAPSNDANSDGCRCASTHSTSWSILLLFWMGGGLFALCRRSRRTGSM